MVNHSTLIVTRGCAIPPSPHSRARMLDCGMDNLTHTIVGLAVGELLHRSAPVETDAARQSTRRRLALSACAAASNFPDLDLLLVRGMPKPLGYLLEHRGHTHTLLLEIPQALLLVALLWLLWPAARRLLAASPPARAVLAASVVTGLLLHIGMDFMNSYGVHPFYPFDGRWLYGDLVFIIEPVFWLGAGVPLILTIARPWLRRGWLIVLVAVLVACVGLGFLHWGSLLLLAAIGALSALGNRGQRRGALVTGLALCLAFIGVQALSSQQARTLLVQDLAARAPDSRLLDAALTAYPANPLCWNAVSMELSGDGAVYHVRRAVLSLAPALLPVTACPAGLTGAVTASPGQAIALLSDDAASVAALRQRAGSDCHFSAWLRFARAPLLDGMVASDLRFGTRLAPNFSTIDLSRFVGRDCPATPPWGMPRADLLAPP
jgi:inner membrane protein